MNRRRADTVAAALLAVVVVGGGALTLRAYQQRRAVDHMMSASMHGPDPLWYLFGTVFLAVAVGGLYLLGRDDLPTADVIDRSRTGGNRSSPPANDAPGSEDQGQGQGQDQDAPSDGSLGPESRPRDRVLDLLPEDERRVLEPVLTSPGVTQIELRDRSDFSKSKVSQTVSALEKRGLLYRERQGRTYRVYPSDELRQRHP